MALNSDKKQGERNWDRLSLFNENSWIEATDKSLSIKGKKSKEEEFANGHSVIKIEPNYYYYRKERNDLEPVIGVTLRNVTFSLDSEWQEMGVPKFPGFLGISTALEGGIGAISEYSVLGGSGEFGSVWMSKKLWRKSGDLRISPEFRIVDWKGDGRPLKAALQIAKYCLPGQSDSDISKTIRKAETQLRSIGKDTQADAKNLADAKKKETNRYIGSVLDSAKSLVDNVSSISEHIFDDIHDIFSMKDSPPPVKVQIGQYFYHPDMVVRNVNFEFSKEVSVFGPLYVDIQLELVSRKILNGINDIGIRETKNITSRVDIQSGQTTVREVDNTKVGTISGPRTVSFPGDGITVIRPKDT